jgi:TonB family protein
VLEVALLWGDTVLALHHFREDGGPVTAGSGTGFRWRLLGVPVAWVPRSFARFAWLVAPTLSEASEECRSDLFLPHSQLPAPNHTLFSVEDGAWVCHRDARWTGRRLRRGAEVGLGALPAGPVVLEEGDRLELELDGLRLVAQPVVGARGLPRRIQDSVDMPFLVGAGALAAVALCLAAVLTGRAPVETAVLETGERLAALRLTVPAPAPQPQVAAPAAGGRSAGDEGRAGEAQARQPTARGKARRRTDREIVADAGVLGVMDEDASLSAVFGSSALAGELSGGIGGAIGAKGVQLGSGGWGSRGTALGGGGETVGMGLGPGVGDGRDRHGAEGGGVFQPKARGSIGRLSSEAVLMGALDKSLVDAVIKRHMNQIRHCYQRQLSRDPSLAGKVTVRFIIGKTGQVQKATVKSSSLGSAAVESCIAERFLRFRFPPPKGNGIVIVSYPFLFSPG